jgi:hypothetical protein
MGEQVATDSPTPTYIGVGESEVDTPELVKGV